MKALISFQIMGRPDLHFRPFAVDGTEGLSQLYKFDIDCFGDLAKRPDTLELVGKRAMLRFELEGAEAREVFGIIKTITTGAPSNYGDARYRFQLVPWLERLNYSRASQIHGTDKEVSVVDVLESELRGGLRRETRVADTDFRIFEHELRLKNRDSYPKRDHLVQSEETDFAFITRLAEHHGIYYFFENSGGVEKVVFADDNMFTKPIEGDIAIDWKPWGAGSRAGSPDTIQAFDETIRMMPRRMWMLDYNYRAPHVPLLASAEIDSHGLGHWVEYGSHHRTPAEGNVLARIRAEEMRSNQRRWNGKSAVARLSPGRSFKLNNHPYADWNQEYLVVSVHHEVRVPMPGVEIAEDWAGYRNSFEVIQQKTAFRPARVTPKPRMDGLMNARIDGAGQRDKAELDDQGRYRVRVPFDNSDTPDGKGSQWVRMASPFGGDGDGMHFPLAPDTEVVIACVNGDPNRPVILGAVPNPRNKSVVTKANSRQNVIATRTGMSVVMGSDGGSGGVAGGGSAAARVATPSAYGPGPDMTTPDAFGAEPVVTANDLETPPQLSSSTEGAGSNYIALTVTSPLQRVHLGSGKNITTPTGFGTAAKQSANSQIESVQKHDVFTSEYGGKITKTENVADRKYDVTTTTYVSPAKKDYTTEFTGPGIYTEATGPVFTKATGAMGFDAGQAILVKAGSSQKADIDMSATGQIRLYAVGELHIFSDSEIKINAKGKITQKSTSTEATINGEQYEVVTSDSKKLIQGKQTSIVEGDADTTTYGNRKTTTINVSTDTFIGERRNFSVAGTVNLFVSGTMNIGLAGNFNLGMGLGLSVQIGPTAGINLLGRATVVQLIDFKYVFGLDMKVTQGDVANRLFFNINLDTAEVKKCATFASLQGMEGRIGSLSATAKMVEGFF